MFIDVLGAVFAASHVVTIALIILWLGLGKPKSRKEFWTRCKREFRSLRSR